MLIPTVGGSRVRAADVRCLSFEHVLCDVSALPLEWVPQERRRKNEGEMVDLSLASAGILRRDPTRCPANLRLDSVEVAARELAALPDGAVVADVTTVDEGFDLTDLQRIKTKVHLIYGASVARGERDVAGALRRQLQAKPAPAFISVKLDDDLLRGAKDASGGRVLVVVTLPACTTISELQRTAATVDDLLGTTTPKLLRCPTRCPWETFATSETTYVLIDGFGRPFDPAPLYLRPGDVDVADLDRLTNFRGGTNYLVSVGVRHKNQLQTYGGHGYAYALDLVKAHSIGGEPDLVANRGVLDALAIDVPLEPVAIAVPQIRCTLCNTSFPRPKRAGFYYAKFDYVYCTRKCLDRHRILGFPQDILQGPRASAQRL